MIKTPSLKLFFPSICYFFLVSQTLAFYCKTQSNQTISQQLQQNANTGSIAINSANQVNILASQNQTSNNYSFNASSFVGTTSNEEELKSATTVSPLLSSNNIDINANGGNGNINLLSAILTGEGNLNLNGNVNMQSLQDSYYSYSHHELTSMNIGALIAELLAAAIIGALTAGAGALAIGAIGMATAATAIAQTAALVTMIAAIPATMVTSAVVSVIGVTAGIGIDAAIDANNGGYAGGADMQSGYMDSTTKQYSNLVGNSLLFGGDVNINSTTPAVIHKATQIDANNINQTANTSESALYQHTHSDITPDWNSLMTTAAITGVISGVTVAGGDAFLAWAAKQPSGSLAKGLFNFNEYIFNGPLRFTILGHDIYPGVETLTRSALEGGASAIENSVHNN